MGIPYERLQELYEIADGAHGDGPWMRGLAIEHLRKNGHEYPARLDERTPQATVEGSDNG